MKRFILIQLLIVLAVSGLFAQGTIRGVVVDGDNQEALIGAVIQVEGTSIAALTDIDGAYSIQVPAGTYTVNHTYVGYQAKGVSDVVVEDGDVISLDIVSLGTGAEAIDAVVITYSVQKNTEAGLLNYQRESTKILDAVSAQSIAKTGDGNVAAVVKRVPGVTIEGGKYVYVRGLGDRYSKSILNGMEIPGLDPERNTVQMDIFPSNIIDNIVVYKTFSPDLPGDFTGGMVDVSTKDFPLEKEFKISSSLGFNTETTFQDDYLLYESNFSDAFGLGKSDREIPIPLDYDFAEDQGISQRDFENVQAFNNRAQPVATDNFFNTNLALSYGNQYDVGESSTFGFIGAISHTNSYNNRPNWVRDDLLLVNGSAGAVDSANGQFSAGSAGLSEGLLNGLLGLALKNDNNSYSLKAMHTRAGEKSVLSRDIDLLEQDFNVPSQNTALGYYQRDITNLILSGDNYFGDKELNWSIAGTTTNVDNPDLVQTNMFKPNNIVFNSNSVYSREWRELSDENLSAKVDFTNPFTLAGRDSFVKVGALGNYRTRDFIIFNASAASIGTTAIPDQNLDNILADQFLAGPNQAQGFTITNFDPSALNQFDADSQILAGYAMTDLQLTDKLEFIGGARVENFVMNYTGEINTDTGREFFDGETLNETELLPSANLVYELKDFMNLRASYNRTLARPSFKEKSATTIFDPIQAQFFNGNIDLTQSLIDNFDLRWEYYFTDTELVSFSPFYKKFDKPIEIIAITASDVQPRNQDEADVFGFEFELRKDFTFIDPSLEGLSFNGNFTYVDSKIDLTPEEIIKYQSTTIVAPSERTLLGQSPFSVNAGLDYRTPNSGFEGNLSYNVKGETLSIVGIGLTPNVFEDPFHNLDLKVAKSFGSKYASKISLTARNLLNDNIEYFYEFDDEEKGTFNSFDVGQTFSLGYSINLAASDNN